MKNKETDQKLYFVNGKRVTADEYSRWDARRRAGMCGAVLRIITVEEFADFSQPQMQDLCRTVGKCETCYCDCGCHQ